MTRFILCVLCALWGGPALPAEPWSTYRGNPQRTGNTDGMPGPARPAVLWVVRSADHFVAAPVPVGDRVYVAGLGAFNRPTSAVYPLTPNGPNPEPVWARTAPYLKLASVCSPAVSGGRLVFGDGMHQDAGGVLHCLTADAGRPLWQLPVTGDLVHLEGTPAVAEGRVFVGGGSAGVVCVELDRATLDGKDLGPSEIATLQEAKWKELQARYEADRKKDPDFAVPSGEDQLPKPAPRAVWRQGQGRWHVDAPVCVAGDKVLVASSYLDKEKAGERAVHCLNAATGDALWTAPLKLNPWGGASVDGTTAVVTGSSTGYYLSGLKGAKGDVTALDLATGKERWRKEVPGGVVGCAALADGLAVTTATDGKVRAFALADGDRAWVYDAKYPVFAPPAVAAGLVYVADLQGTVHALDLKTGTATWTFSLAKDAAVRAPGMVYGGVTVHAGKLLVATCNLEGPTARQPTVFVCLGSK